CTTPRPAATPCSWPARWRRPRRLDASSPRRNESVPGDRPGPAEGIGHGAVLDPGDGVVEAAGEFAHGPVADHHGLALVEQLLDRRDHRCGSGAEDLAEVAARVRLAHLVDGDRALGHGDLPGAQ